MITIDVAKDFSETPGGRTYGDGVFSAEDFFDNHLDPAFASANGEKVRILMDGAAGFGASFIDEAFRRVGKKYGLKCLDQLEVVSEDHTLVSEVLAAVIEPSLSEDMLNCWI